MMFAAVAASATVFTLAMPLLVNDTLTKRMKAVRPSAKKSASASASVSRAATR
jgi:hypothetical protein